MDSWDIDYTIKEAFSGTEFVMKALEDALDGWRYLVRVPQGAGKREMLVPAKAKQAPQIKFYDLMSCVSIYSYT
jgi:hypothetical protein